MGAGNKLTSVAAGGVWAASRRGLTASGSRTRFMRAQQSVWQRRASSVACQPCPRRCASKRPAALRLVPAPAESRPAGPPAANAHCFSPLRSTGRRRRWGGPGFGVGRTLCLHNFLRPEAPLAGRELYKRNLALLVPFLWDAAIELRALQRLPPGDLAGGGGGDGGSGAAGAAAQQQQRGQRAGEWWRVLLAGGSPALPGSQEGAPVRLLAEWRLTCWLRLPWAPFVAVNGTTTYTLGADQNKVWAPLRRPKPQTSAHFAGRACLVERRRRRPRLCWLQDSRSRLHRAGGFGTCRSALLRLVSSAGMHSQPYAVVAGPDT